MSARYFSRRASPSQTIWKTWLPSTHPVRVVVDRLAGPGEEPGRRVVLAEDQVRVRLASTASAIRIAIWAEGRPGQPVGPAERLRAEVDVDAEGSALADEPVEQERGVLGELVVLDEELLELVDQEQDPREVLVGPGRAVAGDVLRGDGAVHLAATLQLDVEPLEDAQAELALALDGDDPGVGQLVDGVGLELDALLEVDQVELDLLRAVPEGDVGDQGVEQRRLTGAGLAGDQDVLRRALAELEVLELGGAGAAEGDVDPGPAVGRPVLVGGRRDDLEWDLDAAGLLRLPADLVEDLGQRLGRRGLVGDELERLEDRVAPDELAVAARRGWRSSARAPWR